MSLPPLVELPASALVHEIASPGFDTSPPEIRFRERIPADLIGALSAQWGASHPGRAVRFHLLRNVFVAGEGLVFDEHRNLYRDTIAQTPAALIEASLHRLQEPAPPTHPGPALLCGKIGLNNYGHWLVEMLPIAFLCRHLLAQEGWAVLVPHVYPWMAPAVGGSLDLLGLDPSRRILGDGGPRFVEQLMLVTGLTQHAHYYSPLILACMDALAGAVPAGPAERVWISRAGDRRRLANEAVVCRALEREGWRIAHPGQMSFAEQVALGKGARHLAGVNGAGLSNLLFMPPGGQLTSFMPAYMPDVFFWQLCGQRGLRYREVRCLQEPDLVGATRWDTELRLGAAEVLAELGRRSMAPGI